MVTVEAMSAVAPADEVVDAWWNHWPYFKLSVVLFLVGSIIGAILITIGVDLFAALGFEEIGDALPDEITTMTILVNNTVVFLLALVGLFSFGLLSALILVFNGVVVGYVVLPAIQEVGIGFAIVAIVPHGIPELSAFFVATAVVFRLLHRFIQMIRDQRERLLDPGDGRRIGLLLVVAWIVLAVAAVIEATVTFWLVETLYPEPTGIGV